MHETGQIKAEQYRAGIGEPRAASDAEKALAAFRRTLKPLSISMPFHSPCRGSAVALVKVKSDFYVKDRLERDESCGKGLPYGDSATPNV